MSGSIAVRWSAALVGLAAVVALVIGATASQAAINHVGSTTSSVAGGGHGWID
jgi:hypothetical protein